LVDGFQIRGGLATGLTVLGFGLSALITAPLVVALISLIGLPNTFLVLGIVFLILLFLLGSLMRFPPPDWKAPPVPSLAEKSEERKDSKGKNPEALANPRTKLQSQRQLRAHRRL
jgi:predicted MFS family arabinose efflux permease